MLGAGSANLYIADLRVLLMPMLVQVLMLMQVQMLMLMLVLNKVDAGVEVDAVACPTNAG